MPTALDQAAFIPVLQCWVCGAEHLTPFYPAPLDFSAYVEQDPELHNYTGSKVWMVRCRSCGFTQPEAVPRLRKYFDRMYDQRWSGEWIKGEFESTYKDFIFEGILQELQRLSGATDRSLLDIGAHAGRFIHFASRAGWRAEGIELNPLTSAYARERTGLPVHQMNAHELAGSGKRYSAVTLIDVLEHIPEPLQVLREVFDLLEPGGWISVKVPCGPGQRMKEKMRSLLNRRYHPTKKLSGNLVHVSFFSPHSLRLALERCGFHCISISVGAPELHDFQRIPPTMVKRLSDVFRRAVYRAARIVPGGVHSPLALNLQAYGRKD